MVASAATTNTPNSNMINRVKPYTLHGLVENLNEVRRILFINHCLPFFYLVTC
jgi:hypothetical protein